MNFAAAVEESDGNEQLLFLLVLKPDINEVEFQCGDLLTLAVDDLEFSLIEQAVIEEVDEA